jgi:hypothetical protein
LEQVKETTSEPKENSPTKVIKVPNQKNHALLTKRRFQRRRKTSTTKISDLFSSVVQEQRGKRNTHLQNIYQKSMCSDSISSLRISFLGDSSILLENQKNEDDFSEENEKVGFLYYFCVYVNL